MASPFLGEIKIVGFNFAPRGFAFCNGQLLPISQYTALFSILGTTYGGNGTTNFGLPNFQGSAPMHWGSGAGLTPQTLGEQSGTATVTLVDGQLPQHSHALMAGSLNPPNGNQNVPAPTAQAMIGVSNPGMAYSDATTQPVLMAPTVIGPNGSSGPHENRHPILVLNFVIALQGIFPSRN